MGLLVWVGGHVRHCVMRVPHDESESNAHESTGHPEQGGDEYPSPFFFLIAPGLPSVDGWDAHFEGVCQISICGAFSIVLLRTAF
jgi:hypothetical protein